MIKPFQIVWELIEFGIQALFVYVLAIILCVGLIAYVIVDNKEKLARKPKPTQQQVTKLIPTPVNVRYGEKKTEEKVKGMKVERECTRPAGCRVLEDGTIEW